MRISVLVVNLNNLEYTKNCVLDLLSQEIDFNLTLIDQNSSEVGTFEYFMDLFNKHSNGLLNSRINVLSVYKNNENKPLNHIWNEFVSNCETEFICLLNNDVRLSPNFLSSSIDVFDREPLVSIVSHTTNTQKYSKWSNNLNYIVQNKPYRQGWDLIFRKNSYITIPEELKFFYGDDYIFSKIYENGYKGAYVTNSPIIHFERSTTIEKNGQRDCTNDSIKFNKLNLNINNLSFNEEFSKWKPEFFKLTPEFLNHDRVSIINNIIEKNKFKSYLEIGVRNTFDCFDVINCEIKDGVDPGFESEINNVKYKLTSDEFFKELDLGNLDKKSDYKWDVIFIDGLHLSYQVDLDIENSLNHISDNGIIVIHDCNPPSLHHAREDYTNYDTPAKGFWNGTVWKTFFKMRCTKFDLDMCVIDCDWGVGLIKKGSQTLCDIYNPYFEYSIFDKHRVKSLNLIETIQYEKWLLNPYY